jgi:single-strand DNA-binding protein
MRWLFLKIMASSINKVTLVGNLGRDPEIRTTSSGMKTASFSVATSESWRDKVDGERKERVEWHNVVIFNPKLADIVENYYRKGQKVYIEGQLQSRKYTDDQGVERKLWEVVIGYKGESMIIDAKGMGPSDGGSMGAGPRDNGMNNGQSESNQGSDYGAMDDEIPF